MLILLYSTPPYASMANPVPFISP
ncbi:hypothetical protein F383_10132 [Gossypium arboreum]|uniref:Uncharacterized protein n=1 Tax=Gossypium arboreum TaxID=29729 RepID=A0A0B0NFM2_GOSAR|nr:hypothetical protein F383_10132 [Gossypium arboreum]